jgi:uncharacterized protein (DUF1501 family)
MTPQLRIPGSSARVSRRDVFRAALAGAGIFALGPLTRLLPAAHAAPMSLERMVVINASGGCDTLNMVVPVARAPYYTRRPTIAIPEASALLLLGTSAYRLHPAMPKIAALWNEGSVAAVLRTGYPSANLSHFTSMDIFSHGVRNGFGALGLTPSGWIARFADQYAPTAMGAVALGQGRPTDFVGGQTGHLQADSLAAFKIRAAGTSGTQITNAHLYRLQQAKDMLAAFSGTGLTRDTRNALLQAHDLATNVQSSIQTYTSAVTWPNTTLGARLKDVAMLIQGGFETRIFYTGYGGHDTHTNQGAATGYQANLFAQLDNAVGAFAQDMKDRGLWGDVVIVVITEFGRRNYENGSTGVGTGAGTDHGHAWTALAIGGAVHGGVFGPDLVDADLNSEYPAYAVDFRSIYKEVLSRHLGTDPAPVFPEPLQIEQVLGVV